MNATFVIAEAGVNHNGNLKRAIELTDAASDAGADAVKFQTFIPEEVISKHAPKAKYQLAATGSGESQLDMAHKLALSENDFLFIAEHCEKRSIKFLSTPFDLPSLDFLNRKMNLGIIKVPSGEVTNGPYLLHVAETRKTIIMSTGMCTLGEVETALSVLAFGYAGAVGNPSPDAFKQAFATPEGQAALKEKVSLLHCTTEYPTPLSDINLKAMDTLRGAFGLPVGLSDHSQGIAVPIAAVAQGACIIEKHFTLDRSLPGPDHKASLEPGELKAMVAGIRDVEKAMGDGEKVAVNSEIKNIPIARRSLIARVAISAGTPFTEDNLCAKRPGSGISPMCYWQLLGRKAERDYEADELIDE